MERLLTYLCIFIGASGLCRANVTCHNGFKNEFQENSSNADTRDSIGRDEHLKFLGIPICGNINDFQNKLQQKGFSYNPISKSMPAGERWFNGIFANHEASLAVYYLLNNKIVYSLTVYLNKSSYSEAVALKELIDKTIYESILEKYDTCMSEETDDGGIMFYIGEPVGPFETDMGAIKVVVMPSATLGGYDVRIIYADMKGFNQWRENMSVNIGF